MTTILVSGLQRDSIRYFEIIEGANVKSDYKHAKSILKKIKVVLAHQLPYRMNMDPVQSPTDLLGRLKVIAQSVKDGYTEKVSNSNSFKRFFSHLLKRENVLQDLCLNIQRFEYPFDTPAQLANHLAIWKATQYGLKNSSSSNAKEYLENLYKEVRIIEKLLDPDNTSDKANEQAPMEQRLRNLSESSLDRLLPLFLDESIKYGYLTQFISQSSFVRQQPMESQWPIIYRILEKAIANGEAYLIDLVLKLGAVPDPDASVFNNSKKGSFLYQALDAPVNRILCINFLLARGANVNAMCSNGKTIFQVVIIDKQDKELVDLFLKNGANVLTRDLRGDQPLHLIYREKKIHSDILNLLLEAGADWSKRGFDGKTALDLKLSYEEEQAQIKARKEEESELERKKQRERYSMAANARHVPSIYDMILSPYVRSSDYAPQRFSYYAPPRSTNHYYSGGSSHKGHNRSSGGFAEGALDILGSVFEAFSGDGD